MGMPGTIEHKKALQRSANIKVAIAIGMVLLVGAAIGAIATTSGGTPSDVLIIPLVILRYAALVPWFWGLSEYAKSKGYPGTYALWGILSCIGLLVLVLIPDKYYLNTAPPQYGPTNYPRDGGVPPA